MSSADVSKFAVVDPRVLQTKPKYAVEKGALSLTNQSFTSIANSDSQVAWNVQVPSENIFVDREIRWAGSVKLSVTLTRAANIANGAPVVVPGLHFAPAAFPFHQCVSTMSTTINDATTSINTSDVMSQILRLADQSAARKQRTCPTMLDRYAAYPDSADVAIHNSPLDSYGASYNPDEQPNGAWGRLTFTAGTGTAITNGLPVNDTGGASQGPFTFVVEVQSSEKLLLSPFIFADDHGLSTGLFGVQNIQVLANLAAPSRALRFAGSYFASAPVVTYSTSTPFTSPKLNVQFLTPALDVPLPPKSIVPYMEYPRYITPVTASWNAATTGLGLLNTSQVTSNTITLPNIPDLLMIYARSTPTTLQGDYVNPISQISINFDNFSGLLAGHTQEQLYEMSVKNGLDMDWNTWSGVAALANAGALAASGRGAVATAGGPLVLRPGRDIVLQAGQAPGLVGNFTFQFTAQISSYLTSPSTSVSLFVVAISSGFFETIKGSSRIIKGVLTESDILSAPMAAPSAELQRDVGAAMPKHSAKNGRMAHSGMSKYM
jgi:hypothetical protein